MIPLSHNVLFLCYNYLNTMVSLEKIISIISLIKQIAKTDEVYLFGSYANNTANDNSDIDIAIVKDDISNELEESFAIRKIMLEKEYLPMDIVFLDRKKFNARKKYFGNLYYEIANKGKKF